MSAISAISERGVQKEISTLIDKKQKLKKSRMLKQEIIKDERKTMMKIAKLERRASELNTKEFPESDVFVDWREFVSNFDSSHRQLSVALRQLMRAYSDEYIDLRPYMIHSPYTCTTTDKF